MQATVTVEETGPCQKKISVEVGVEQIRAKMDEKYAEFLKTASIRGFRKGHVPRGLAEKRYGKDIRAEVQEALMSETLQETIEEKSLDPIGAPKFDNISFEEDQPLTYDVVMHVKPVFELKDYKGIEATRPSTEVDDKAVDDEIESMRKMTAQAVPVEGEPVAAEHHLMTKFMISVDGEEIIGRDSAYLVLSEDHLFGIPVENLAEKFVGKNQDETVEVDVTLPDSFPKEELRGKPATVACTILDIKKLELPEANDEWASQFDYDSMDDVREALTERMKRRKQTEADAAVEDEILDKIIADNVFDMPEEIIDHELHHFLERQRQAMESREMPEEEIQAKLDEQETEQREEQVKRFKAFFILDKIGTAERIFTTEDDVDQRIAALASHRQQSPADARRELEESDNMGALRTQIREEKTRIFLRENATVKEAAEPAKKKPAAKKPATKKKKKETTESAKKTKKKS